MKYYTIQNNSLITAETEAALKRFYKDVSPLPDDYVQGKYVVEDGVLVLNEDFEAEQAQIERERLNMLSLTAADVERAIYKAKGMDFEDVIKKVEELNSLAVDEKTSEPLNLSTAQPIDIKALKIELKANNFYRGNPYIDTVGKMLGYSMEDLDHLFETGELPEKVEENQPSPQPSPIGEGETEQDNTEEE